MPNPLITLFITKVAPGETAAPVDFKAVKEPTVVPTAFASLKVVLVIELSVGGSPGGGGFFAC